MPINIIFSDKYLLYDPREESPIPKTKTDIFFKKLLTSKIKYKIIEPEKAKDEDILLVHSKGFLEEIRRYENRPTMEAAGFIVGGTILCANLALTGKKAVNLIGGMHHAGISQASGFCIFNDHAIAIRKLQHEGKIKKAAVYDLDVHAGQGTQEIFYSDPTVLTVSIHQDPKTIYPGTGFESQRGDGAGLGFNINIPLPPLTLEKDYLAHLDAVLEKTRDFNPDLTFLVLGVDTYRDDGLGNFLLTQKSYGEIAKRFQNVNNLAIVFSGGYSSKVPDLWLSFLEAYIEIPAADHSYHGLEDQAIAAIPES